MNSDKSDVQEVLVDVPKYDKDGHPISLDSLSSGGARKPGGSIIVQYRNPRLPKSANEHEVDRDFNKLARRNSHALRRREEEAEERRRRDRAERAARFVLDNVAKPLVQQFVIPLVTELWDTKVLPEGKRRAQCLLRPKMSQSEVPHESVDAPEFAVATATPLATSQQSTDHTSEISTVQERGEDTPLADVIQMDDYKKRRSA